MKKRTICWRCIRTALGRIHLVDKCLIVFMIVLLLQSTYNLFTNHGVSTETNHIDIIIRTSMAAIFGYFISANFINHAPGEKEEPDLTNSDLPAPSRSEKEATNRLQIFAATGIGLFCLLVLIVVRNFAEIQGQIVASSSTTATIAQFRDFVSGCVGFLIGCPTSKSDKPK